MTYTLNDLLLVGYIRNKRNTVTCQALCFRVHSFTFNDKYLEFLAPRLG